jgi:cytochrome c oxidase assembly protein subunit 11
MSQRVEKQQRRNRRTTLILSGLVVVMLGFGFALAPLYNLFCQITGTQSLAKRSDIGQVKPTSDEVDKNRWITVKFDTTVNPNLPWELDAETTKMRVHPGQIYEVNFHARNHSQHAVTGQAIPSVAPWQATPYFSKLECFCFYKQKLGGQEKTIMPLQFMVSTQLPDEINSLTLSYSFMRLKVRQTIDLKSKQPPMIAANPDQSLSGPIR